MRGVLIALTILASCKVEKPDGRLPEGAQDGKAMVRGCVWIIDGHGDDTAYCDDGRICGSDDDGKSWKCVQHVRPCDQGQKRSETRDEGGQRVQEEAGGDSAKVRGAGSATVQP